jgi:hypothetical protein
VNEAGVGYGDRMKHAFEFVRPKIEKFPQAGEFRVFVKFLPEIGLQNGGVVRQTIENIGGRQPVASLMNVKDMQGHNSPPQVRPTLTDSLPFEILALF